MAAQDYKKARRRGSAGALVIVLQNGISGYTQIFLDGLDLGIGSVDGISIVSG